MSESKHHQPFNVLVRVIGEQSGSIEKIPLSATHELWVNAHGGGAEVMVVDRVTGEDVARKSYVHGRRAVGGTARLLQRLGIDTASVEQGAPEPAAASAPLPSGGREDAAPQVSPRRASAKSIWLKKQVCMEGELSRGNVSIPIVLKVEDGICRFIFNVGNIPFVGEFPTEREAIEKGCAKVQGLLDWIEE